MNLSTRSLGSSAFTKNNIKQDRYRGDYKNDLRHGVGELETAEGESY